MAELRTVEGEAASYLDQISRYCLHLISVLGRTLRCSIEGTKTQSVLTLKPLTDKTVSRIQTN